MDNLLKKIDACRFAIRATPSRGMVCSIRDAVIEGKIPFSGHKRGLFPHMSDPYNRESWSSYEGCHQITIWGQTGGAPEGAIYVGIDVYSGDTLDGARLRKRWAAIFHWPIDDVGVFSCIIDAAFEAELERRKNEIARQILGG